MELKKKILVGMISIIVLLSCGIYYFLNKDNNEDFEIENNVEIFENVINEPIINEIYIGTKSAEENEIVVHIAGCIVNPGIISLKEGSRVIDAINEAGGTTRRSGFK